jgi:prepilin-type N-terminal cleavage/methylation domain-containing protein
MNAKKKKKRLLRNEEGFTLIEIIAVIIIMGILAAVAVPKFFSMQEDAKIAALNGGLSEAIARFNHAYAKYILVEKKAPHAISGYLNTNDYLGDQAAGSGTDIGDFVVTWVKQADDTLKITVVSADTIGASALAAMAEADKTKTVDGITWGPA